MANEAARLGDPVGHSLGMAGVVGGAVAGALLGAALLGATVMTGGAAGVFAAAAIAGAVGGGALAGGKLLDGLQTVLGLSDPTTGTLSQGSPDVRVNGKPAIRAGVDYAAQCSGLFSINHPSRSTVRVAEGSKTVRVNGHPAGRVGDRLECAAAITEGSSDVRFGGPTDAVLAVHDDEADAKAFAGVLLLVGAAGAAGLAGLAGGVAGVLKLGAVAVGFTGLDTAVGWLGDQIGPGWRDTLQGTLELGALFAGGRKAKDVAEAPPARAAVQRATRERVEANIEASRAARRASNFEVHLARNDQLRWGYGADEWYMVDLPSGTRVAGGLPGQSAYYTTVGDLASTAGSRSMLFQSLQVKPHPQFGYRPRVGIYELVEDVRVPAGTVEANPDLGPGGSTQYFIRAFGKNLKLVATAGLGD